MLVFLREAALVVRNVMPALGDPIQVEYVCGVYIYTYVCVYTQIHTYIHIYIYACVYAYIIHISYSNIRAYVYVIICTFFVCIYMHIITFKYIHTYIRTYIYIHTYIYTYYIYICV